MPRTRLQAETSDKSRKASDKFLTGEQFKVWRLSRGLTLKDVGEFLGLSHQGVSQYEIRGASKVVALALAALDKGLKPWSPSKSEIKEARQKKRGDPLEQDPD